MKRNTTPTLRVTLRGVDTASIERVTFLFKQQIGEDDVPALLEKVFPGADVTLAEEKFNLYLSREDTRRLPVGQVYMDTLVEMRGGRVPATSIVRLKVEPTLFGEVYRLA